MTNAQKYKMAKGRLDAAKTEAAKKSARASMKKYAPAKKKPAAKKPAAKRSTAKKPAAKRSTAKKPAAKRSAATRKRKFAAAHKRGLVNQGERATGSRKTEAYKAAVKRRNARVMAEAAKPTVKISTRAPRKPSATHAPKSGGALSAAEKARRAAKAKRTRTRNLREKEKAAAAAKAKRTRNRNAKKRGGSKKKKAITHHRKATRAAVKARPRSRAKLPKLAKSKRRATITAKKRGNKKGATPRQIAKRTGSGLSRAQKKRVAQTFRSKRKQIKVADYHTQVWADRKTHKKTSISVNKHYAPNPAGEGVMGVVKLTATLAIALVAMDLIDRQIATMKPGGGNYYGKDAEIRLLAKPSIVRVAVPAGVGVAALVGSAYLMEKYPTWAYVTAGLGIAGVVYAGYKGITHFLAPMVLAAPNGDEMSMANAWYPMEQEGPQKRIAAAIEAQDKAVTAAPWYPFKDKAAYDAAAASATPTLPASFKGELPLPTTQKPPTEGFSGLAGIPRYREPAQLSAPNHTAQFALGAGAFVEPRAASPVAATLGEPRASEPSAHVHTQIESAPAPTGLGCAGGCGGAMPAPGAMCKGCSAKKAASDLGLTVPEGYKAVGSIAADGSPVISFAPLAGAPAPTEAPTFSPVPAAPSAPIVAKANRGMFSATPKPKTADRKRPLFTTN